MVKNGDLYSTQSLFDEYIAPIAIDCILRTFMSHLNSKTCLELHVTSFARKKKGARKVEKWLEIETNAGNRK